MFQFNETVCLSEQTRKALALVNACVELINAVKTYEERTFKDDKEDCLNNLLEAAAWLRASLAVSVEDALITNPTEPYKTPTI